MARSKHTQPDELLAKRRLRAPYESRGKNDQTSYRLTARALKEFGISLKLPHLSENQETLVRPRIVTKPPRAGFLHPAEKKSILAVLEFFGDSCVYGLRSVRLSQGATTNRDSALLFGRLEVPGTIILYDQPTSPWFINGIFTSAQTKKLQKAGAVFEIAEGGFQTLVHWSKKDLENFMLFDVFMHEVGHHMIQQYKGKRDVRVARTKDHEAFANMFANRCREEYLNQDWSNDIQ